MNENSKRNYKLIISIIVTIMILGGATYAAWNYLTEKTNVVMNVDGDRINFNAGEDITVNNMMPVSDKADGVVKTIEVYKHQNKYKAGINLYLQLTTWPKVLSDKSFRWALYKNDKYLSSGDFKNNKQGDKVRLTTNNQNLKLEAEKDTYTLYLWIDAYQESNINMINQSFTVSLYGEVSYYDNEEYEYIAEDKEPNAPELVEGMIPVKYDYVTDNWVKADTLNTNNDWYNYGEKYWANAVMVTSETRDRYMNASVNTNVLETDILAYYVWIPRYKYLLFNVNSDSVTPREIQIEFQKTTDTIENGDENGEFLTHPAFWWDNNSDGVRDSGEELSGIWVGKFETGGSVNSPLVKPNITSLRNVNVYNLFNTNKNLGTSNYLTNAGATQADAHMMKNTEWGVVAYLSHSRYGTNSEICINNSNGYMTGRSGGAVGGSVNTVKVQYPNLTTLTNQYIDHGYYTYNDLFIDYDGNYALDRDTGMGTCASTTGNISGIYDMSGGSWEYVMAVTKNSSGSVYYNGSGFSGTTIPIHNYYNLYNYDTSASSYSRRILGDATGETRSWYFDSSNFISSSNSWFLRGGRPNTGNTNGIFAFQYDSGNAWDPCASRSVLVLP